MTKQVIICVDDETIVLDALKVELKEALDDDYLIEMAEGGEEALELTKKLLKGGYEIALVISDQVMPDIKGDELLKQIHLLSPETFKIMLTGQANLEAVGNAIKYANLYRYITKPWQPNDLKLTVKEAVNSYIQKKQLVEQTVQLQQMNQALQELNREQAALIAELQQTEEKYRSIFENAIEGIFQTSLDGRFLSANPALAHNLGYDSVDELIATLTDMQHQLYADPHRRTEFVNLMQQHDRVSGFEAEGYRKDGSILWVSINARTVRDADGKLQHFQGFILDITERKQAEALLADYNKTLEKQVAERTLALEQEIIERKRAEEALQASEAELRLLFDAMNDTIIVFDAKGRYLKYIQPQWSRAYKPAVKRIGKTVYEILPNTTANLFIDAIGKALYLRKQFSNVIHCPESNQLNTCVEYSLPILGKTVWFSANVTALSEDTVLWVARDISDRKRTEAALQESEARFRQLAEATFEAIAVIEEDGRIVDTNQTFAQIFGYEPSEVIGMQASDFVASEYRELCQQKISSGAEGVYENICLRKDGTTFPAEIRTRMISYNGHTVRITVVRDITERKQVEEASILEERNRMAREIHDSLAQAFTGIIIQLEAISRVSTILPEQAQLGLIQIYDLARSGLNEARRSVKALRPQLLEEGSLHSALDRLASKMDLPNATHTVCQVVGTPYPLPSVVENNLLRIGQEALTNAIRHANAGEIKIELIYEKSQCILRVKDNGQGFDLSNMSASKGFGLLGMQERAKCIAAHLTIESDRTEGTEVVVSVNRE
jgi:PAS domain S-box-containing protein